MRRREFLGLVGLAASAWPLPLRAQQRALPVVGFLHSGSPDQYAPFVAAFQQGLKDAGYIDGQNVTIEYRWAYGQNDRIPELVADLVRRQVAVIASNSVGAKLAKAATRTIPIVFFSGTDPVEFGLAASLNRPGGNATGVYFFTTSLGPKRLGLLLELVPNIKTIAMLLDASFVTTDAQLKEAEEASRALGRKLVSLKVDSNRGIEASFANAVKGEAQALLVGASPLFTNRRRELVALAARHSMPALYDQRDFVEVGGLVSYGASLRAAVRQVGLYTARILKGEKPADLPVDQAAKLELVLNTATARALGIDIPAKVLAIADEVIE
jgi:putative ABC transport system substrate-binding protein